MSYIKKTTLQLTPSIFFDIESDEKQILKSVYRKLKPGDLKKIAKLTGYAHGYVRNCFSTLYYSKQIVAAAQLIIDERNKSDRTLKAKLKRAA